MVFLRTLFLVSAILLVAPLTAHAQSPRAQLDQLVQQLQSKPDDNALRENIIKLAITLKPKPALPEEVERRMVRGIAAFKAAQSTADYQDAAREFRQAALAAPWYGDAYYNLGVTQDKAGDFDAALRSLKLALLASPGSKEIKTLTYQVEFRADQANTPDGKAEKEYGPAQRQFAALIQKLDGAVFTETVPSGPYKDELVEVRFYRSGRYNLLKCQSRHKSTKGGPYHDWEISRDEYIFPSHAGGKSPNIFYFPDNGQEFFSGCIGGRLTGDGQTIEEILTYSISLQVIGLMHRQ